MRYRLLLLFYFLWQSAFPQSAAPADSLRPLRARKIVFGTACGAAAAGSLIYLNKAWYQPYASSKFHWFNDDGEWLQMDKAGHCFTTYQTGRLMMQSMRWAGFSEAQSTFIGGASGFAYMTAIEIMDGFSGGWGFSWGDMGMNAAGSALATAQQFFWKEQRISLKFSFHQTTYPQYRPKLLGSDLSEQILKDYNGQTYWLSVNVASFLPKETRFPRWLNIAAGYGAEGMISGDNGYVYVTGGTIIGNNRYRKILLSLDIDFARIKTKNKFLKSIFSFINCFKLPFPALEFNPSGTRAHLLYF